MTRLASNEPRILRSETIGEAWFAVAGRIVEDGVASRYGDLPIREISLVTLAVARPDPDDEIIAAYAEPERLAWMHANFTDHSRVTALGDADSYATRLFDYEHSGRDQVRWVIDRLRTDPTSRSATITTFQPHTDTDVHPVRQHARLLAARRHRGAGRVRAQHRLRRQGLRQPGRTGFACSSTSLARSAFPSAGC